MEFKLLSGRGKVLIKDDEKEVTIPPYPKMIHPPRVFDEPMVAELKWDGYNVRTFLMGNIVSILRGGRPDDRTRDMILMHYDESIRRFFENHSDMILCGEVIGKKTMAKYKGVDFDYLIFDIIEMGSEGFRFLGYKEKREIIEEYGFNYVGMVGIFQSFEEVLERMRELPGPEMGVEGVVLKTLNGEQVFKLRYDMHPQLFRDKIRSEWKRKERAEEIIFAHFIQGYPEEELGLKRGITIDEFRKIEREMESFYNQYGNLDEKYEEVCNYLYKLILGAGDFNEEIQAGLYKVVKRYVTKEFKKAKKYGNA